MPSGTPQIEVTPPAKPWWKSKIVLFNLAAVMLAAAEASLGLIQSQLPVNAFAVIAFTVAVVNAALRFITTQAITMRAAQPDEAAK